MSERPAAPFAIGDVVRLKSSTRHLVVVSILRDVYVDDVRWSVSLRWLCDDGRLEGTTVDSRCLDRAPVAAVRS